jgi:type VI secretion system protein ImpA
MPAVDGFDPDALLEPIPGDVPTGADPRENFSAQSRYFRLRDARSEARAAERQENAAAPGDAVPPAQWAPVWRLGAELLAEEAKDLEVASWCAEALLRTSGLPGLTAALYLMRGLVERCWDGLFPLPDEDGIATRVAPIAGLNGEGGEGTLAQPLRKLILFERHDGTQVALWQYQQSVDLAGVGDVARREQRIAAGVLPFEQMETEAQSASPTAFARLRDAAVEASDAWQSLSEALDAAAGRDAPPTSRIRELLRDLVDICVRYAPVKSDVPAQAPTTGGPERNDAAMPVTVTRRGIETREDALHVLAEVADFFRRTEPHSPLAFTLYEAVRRGRLTWPELLEEIVPDTDSRSSILLSLGIRPPRPEE